MIALALPWLFGAALAASAVVAALHLLSVRRPPELLLPTARFLPERDVRAISRTRRPSDLLLLALRIAALLCAGLAASGPTWRPSAASRVVLVIADADVAVDTVAVRAMLTSPDAQVVMRWRANAAGNGDDAMPFNAASLFPIAWRDAARVVAEQAGVDSIDLHVLTAQAPDTTTAAWRHWRAAWPGRVTMHTRAPVTVADSALDGTSASLRPKPVIVDDDAASRSVAIDDPIRAALSWHAARRRTAGVLVPRADTIWLTSDSAGSTTRRDGQPVRTVRVRWPLHGVPAGWQATTARRDSAVALVSSGHALMGPWPIRAAFARDGAPPIDHAVRVLAWWSDGRTASVERAYAASCDRDVAVPVSPASDVLLSASANALFDRLLAPCVPRRTRAGAGAGAGEGAGAGTGADAGSNNLAAVQRLTTVTVDGTAMAAAPAFSVDASVGTRRSSWIVPALLGLAVVLLLVEGVLRARTAQAVA